MYNGYLAPRAYMYSFVFNFISFISFEKYFTPQSLSLNIILYKITKPEPGVIFYAYEQIIIMRKTSLQPPYYTEQVSRRMTILKYTHTHTVFSSLRCILNCSLSPIVFVIVLFGCWYHSNNERDLRNSILGHRNRNQVSSLLLVVNAKHKARSHSMTNRILMDFKNEVSHAILFSFGIVDFKNCFTHLFTERCSSIFIRMKRFHEVFSS